MYAKLMIVTRSQNLIDNVSPRTTNNTLGN